MGQASEMGALGLGRLRVENTALPVCSTGVYSNADLAANWAGYRFYNDLAANPDMIFDIGRYVSPLWSEEFNESFYAAEVAPAVWTRILAGYGGWEGDAQRVWKGHWTGGPTAAGPACSLTAVFKIKKLMSVDAAFKPLDIGGKPIAIELPEGTIVYERTRDLGVVAIQSMSPGARPSDAYSGTVISGIHVSFGSGAPTPVNRRGYLVYIDERHFVGRFDGGPGEQTLCVSLSSDGNPAFDLPPLLLAPEMSPERMTPASLDKLRAPFSRRKTAKVMAWQLARIARNIRRAWFPH
jgi:hypothetical protein